MAGWVVTLQALSADGKAPVQAALTKVVLLGVLSLMTMLLKFCVLLLV